MHRNSIHSLTERCKSTKYPVIKLGLDESGPFRRLNLGQENDDLLNDMHCRAIEMYSDQPTCLLDYSLYTVTLKYKDKDGEDCVILSGDEVVDAIIEYQGSPSFKVIAHVKENGIEPIGSLIGVSHDHNLVERREDYGDRISISMNSNESRDGQGELSVLTTEPPKRLLKKSSTSSRRKSLFRIFKRKGHGVGADSLKPDEEASTISYKDNAALLFSEPSILAYDECTGGIGASYSVSCLSGDIHDENHFGAESTNNVANLR